MTISCDKHWYLSYNELFFRIYLYSFNQLFFFFLSYFVIKTYILTMRDMNSGKMFLQAFKCGLYICLQNNSQHRVLQYFTARGKGEVPSTKDCKQLS